MMKLNRLLFAVVLLLTWHQASAQVEGDVFFDNTAITANAGDEITVPALFFSGASAFGGVEFEISFDSSVLEFVEATAPDGDFNGIFSVYENNDNLVSIVVGNQTSLTGPTGSVPLVNLVYRVSDAGAGQTTAINAVVRDNIRNVVVDNEQEFERFPNPDFSVPIQERTVFSTTVTVQ